MGELQWSDSRINTLRKCKRRYYYNYFLSDNGWLSTSSVDCKLAYRLKKIVNIYGLVGTIVHNTIDTLIQQAKTQKDWAESFAVSQLENSIKQSLTKGWVKSPSKCVNLFEHYYKKSFDVNYHIKKIQKSIENLFNSKIFRKILDMEKKDFITMEQFQHFTLNTNEKVAVKLDFGFRQNNKVYIVDWKTGKYKDTIAEQMRIYVMHSLKMGWVKRVEDVVAIPVFLAADPAHMEIPIDMKMADLIKQANVVRKEWPLLVNAESQKLDIANFPITENVNECGLCNFREMCDGSKRL